nr:hypothetical protein [Tanacetum cinerariifolium]
MSNTNNNLQTQTSNALHNAIMKADGKDRPPMLAPGSSENTTKGYMENYKNVSLDIRNKLDAEAEVVQIILTGIDNDIYSTVDACPNACEMYWEFRKFTSRDGESLESYYSRSQQAATRNRGKAIVNSPPPTYDQEPTMVARDDKMSKEKEIDTLMTLISLSCKKIYKLTNNNLKTSSNTNIANKDNTLRINKGTGYDNQRVVNVVGAKENVDKELEANYLYMAQIQEVTLDAADNSEPIFDTEQLQKVEIGCAKAKGDLVSYKRESQKSLNEHTQKIYDLNQMISEMTKELVAHQKTISTLSLEKEAQNKFYKTREDKEFGKVISLENKVKVLDDIVYKTGQSVQTMNMLNRNCKTSFVKPEFLKKAQRANPRLYDIGCYNDNIALMLALESDEAIRLAQESRSKLRVISTTSVSRPQLKSNQLEDRVMPTNSQGKKQEVEDHRRNFKFSNNKTFVTACNDSLNAKTSNVNFVCATCGKCVLNENHDMCVLYYINGMDSRTKQPIVVAIITREPKRTIKQSVAIPLKRKIAS